MKCRVRNCRQVEQQQKSELLRLQENIAALQLERDRLKTLETSDKVIQSTVLELCHPTSLILYDK